MLPSGPTATSSGVAAIYSAFAAIAAGFHRSILVVGGEKMTHLPTPRVSEIIGRSRNLTQTMMKEHFITDPDA